MTEAPATDINIKYIQQIQSQRIEISLLRAQLDDAARDRDAALDRAQAQSKAMAILLDALLSSLRFYGFDRKKFLAAVRRAALAIPPHGPDSLQHAVLFEATNRVLDHTAIRPSRATGSPTS